ncbi:MAG: replicative DNA helicase [Clostridiales bacterium]|nr:replicative DNA helicase [Clostridiales bacterium]
MADSKIYTAYDGLNLPYDLEAEKSVLGAIIIDGSCMEEVASILPDGDCFYIDVHKFVYNALMNMFVIGAKIDIVTLLNELRKDKAFDETTVKPYLITLCESVPSVSNVGIYAKYVKEKYELRSLIVASRDIIEEASAGYQNTNDILDMAEQKIYDIRRGKSLKGLKTVKEVIVEVLDRLDTLNSPDNANIKPISTGIAALDSYITGLNRSDLILLAARPGMGKTSFALNLMRNAAVQSNKTCAFFSLEMSREQLGSRLLSSEARVEGTKLRTGKLNNEEWSRIIEACDILCKTKVYLDDTPGITVPSMKAKLRRLKNLDLVVVDYLQLMASGRRIDNRVQEISEITRGLKILAKELNVPVITLSQLSRASEQRTDHRPQLSDLRDSGSIEQDADIVLFLYREAYYDNTAGAEPASDKNTGECIVAKNRHGESGTAKLHWQGEFMRFTGVDTRSEH